MRLQYPVGTLYDLIALSKDYWTLRPGAAITQVERSGDVTYAVNAAGYRGSLPSGAKTSKRIVFLGDSVTFGLGVEERQSFTRLVETQLRLTVGPVDVANLALFAYGPHEYLSTWRRVGRSLSSDVVVLQLHMNDFGAKPWDQPGQQIGIGRVLHRLGGRLVDLTAFGRRVHQAAHMAWFYGVRPIRRSYFPQSLSDHSPKEILARLRGAKNLDEVDSIPEIHTLLREIKASGARVLLFYAPHETQLYRKDYDDIDAIVEQAFASEADTYIDPLAALRAAGDRARIFRDLLHYDVYGHALVAQILAKPIEQLLAGSR